MNISIHVPAWGTTVVVFVNRVSVFISIHVPAWGTTKGKLRGRYFADISIHVPAWGMTEAMTAKWHQQKYFNPRSRVGNDQSEQRLRKEIMISIHVPAWGTTAVNDCIRLENLIFQSTFPRGERPNSYDTCLLLVIFQSTFPRGERPGRTGHPQGSRSISIHVPAWGTTVYHLH